VHFARRFKFHAAKWPRFFKDVKTELNLDKELEASGYKNHSEQYEKYRNQVLGTDGKTLEEIDDEIGIDEDEDATGDRQNDSKEIEIKEKELEVKEKLTAKELKDYSEISEGTHISQEKKGPLVAKRPSKIVGSNEDHSSSRELHENVEKVTEVGAEVDDESGDVDEKEEMEEKEVGAEEGKTKEDVKDRKKEEKAKSNRRRRKVGRGGLTRAAIRARAKKSVKGRSNGRSRNIQKNRKKQELQERIREWT